MLEIAAKQLWANRGLAIGIAAKAPSREYNEHDRMRVPAKPGSVKDHGRSQY